MLAFVDSHAMEGEDRRKMLPLPIFIAVSGENLDTD
jgi:hypothetical protein